MDLGHFQFVQNGFDFLESGSLVGVSIPADVDDSLEVVVDKLGDDRPGILLHHLDPHLHRGKPLEGDLPCGYLPQYDGKTVHVAGSLVNILQPVAKI